MQFFERVVRLQIASILNNATGITSLNLNAFFAIGNHWQTAHSYPQNVFPNDISIFNSFKINEFIAFYYIVIYFDITLLVLA